MIILPAIDIKDGSCVRLLKGEFDTVYKVAENALDTAKYFEECGASHIHMVDLDGALTSNGINFDIICSVAKNTHLKVETGGGIRNIETVEKYLSNGIDKVILGSAAINDSELVKKAVKEYKERIIIGIDAKYRKVCANGWTENTDIDYIEFAKMMYDFGCRNIIFTDISKDGTLEGPNIAQLTELKYAVPCNITASGGIRDIENIKALKKLDLYGVICGKSIYSKTLDLKEAISESKR